MRIGSRKSLRLPRSIGFSDVSAASSKHTVFLVSEAYGSPQINANLGQIAEILYEEGVRDFYLEGVFQPMTAALLRTVVLDVNPKEALESGRLKPAEYLALAKPYSDFRIHAADDKVLYDQQDFRMLAARGFTRELEPLFAKVESFLAKPPSFLVGGPWLELFELAFSGSKLSGDLATMTREVLRLGTELKIARDCFPFSGLSFELGLLERSVNSEQFVMDGSFACETLAKSIQASLPADPEDPEIIVRVLSWQLVMEGRLPQDIAKMTVEEIEEGYTRGRLSILLALTESLERIKLQDLHGPQELIGLARLLNVSTKSFSRASARGKLAALWKRIQEIKPGLIHNLDIDLEAAFRRAPDSGAAFRWFRLQGDLRVLKKLMATEMDPAENVRVEGLIGKYSFGTLHRELSDLGMPVDDLASLVRFASAWDSSRFRALRFFHFAKLRTKGMAQAVLKGLSITPTQVAVFCGGHHVSKLRRDLDRNGSCETIHIRPKVDDLTGERNYYEIMDKQRLKT